MAHRDTMDKLGTSLRTEFEAIHGRLKDLLTANDVQKLANGMQSMQRVVNTIGNDVNNVGNNLDGLSKSMAVKQDLKDIERVISELIENEREAHNAKYNEEFDKIHQSIQQQSEHIGNQLERKHEEQQQVQQLQQQQQCDKLANVSDAKMSEVTKFMDNRTQEEMNQAIDRWEREKHELRMENAKLIQLLNDKPSRSSTPVFPSGHSNTNANINSMSLADISPNANTKAEETEVFTQGKSQSPPLTGPNTPVRDTRARTHFIT